MKCILYTVLFFLLIPFQSSSQRFVWSPDSIILAGPNYAMDRYHDILRYHDPYMYVAFPIIKPIVDRKVPLRDGEGKNGFWMEGQFGHRFSIYHGKYYTPALFRKIRLTFDVSMMPRMTRDNSSPLLPLNNKFGLGMDYLLAGMQSLKKEKATLLWTTIQLHHYSNGQADSFFLNTAEKRNNYRSGDFSTNYWRILLNLGNANQQKNISTTSLGFQREVNLGGPLSLSPEMKNYYGRNRVLARYQWTQKPKLVTMSYTNHSSAKRDTVKAEVRRQVAFRTELEYITDNLSEFPSNRKGRLGWHNYITYMPSVTNEVGFILHTYTGRDYLNIRFDDLVFIGELGIYVRFNSK